MTECTIDFQHLDSIELQKVGISFATEEEVTLFSEIIQEELEVRIGQEISAGLTETQLTEFDNCTSDYESKAWLEENRPDYSKIVQEQQRKMQQELMEWWPFIPGVLDNSSAAGKPPRHRSNAPLVPKSEERDPFDEIFEVFDEQYERLSGNEEERNSARTPLPPPPPLIGEDTECEDLEYFHDIFKIFSAQDGRPAEHSATEKQDERPSHDGRTSSRKGRRRNRSRKESGRNERYDNTKGRDIA